MSSTAPIDTFPAITSSSRHLIRQNSSNTFVTRRRKSSSLPEDPRGDTGAVALSTLTPSKPDVAAQQRAATEKLHRPHSKRRKAKSAFRRWKSLSLRHTWLNPLVLVLIIVSFYLRNPTPSNPLHRAIFLSYPLPRNPQDPPDAPIQYGKGASDFAFVAFYMLVLSFTREFLMQKLIRPLAILAGIKSRAKQSRFMEQFYTAMYFALLGPFGLYVMSRTPIWYFNTDGMFEGFPHRSHEALFKAYYLLQASYWGQQAVVLLLQLEKARKDFKELVGHHVITLALIWLSYRFHFTYMGLAVYITHDISDFFLATSKVLHYLDSPITGPYFGVFLLIWAYCRHYLNLTILYAVCTSFRTVGPFELNWDTQQYKCWISQYITFSLLACLQSVNIFWFVLILRIAWKYVASSSLADERSDTGSEDEVGAATAGGPARGEESTNDKRRRFGVKPEQGASFYGTQANGAATEGGGAGPTVLLNGEPVTDAGAPATRKPKTGLNTVEVQAQERRRVR